MCLANKSVSTFQVMGFSPKEVASFIAVVGVLSVIAQVSCFHIVRYFHSNFIGISKLSIVAYFNRVKLDLHNVF